MFSERREGARKVSACSLFDDLASPKNKSPNKTDVRDRRNTRAESSCHQQDSRSSPSNRLRRKTLTAS